MKIAILLAALSSASAFAPSKSNGRTNLNALVDGMVGSEGPEPMPFAPSGSSVDFDPLGLATKNPEWVPFYREAELKHGRMAMLGTLGFVVPEFIRVPGEAYSFESIPKVIDAHDQLLYPLQQIFIFMSMVEAMSLPAVAGLGKYDRAPGDFSFDPLGLYPTDPEKQKQMQLAELKNGRLAMIALGGMVHGAIVTGHGFPYLP